MPSTFYNVTVFANTSVKGRQASKTVYSPPETPILINSVISSRTNSTITIKYNFEKPKYNSDNYHLDFYMIDDNSKNALQLIYNCSINTFQNFTLTIGYSKEKRNNCSNNGTYPILKPGTSYNFSINLANTFKNITIQKQYYFSYKTLDGFEETSNSSLLGLLALLLIIPLVIIIGIWYV